MSGMTVMIGRAMSTNPHPRMRPGWELREAIAVMTETATIEPIERNMPRMPVIAAMSSEANERVALFAAGIAAPMPIPVRPVVSESQTNGPIPEGLKNIIALPRAMMVMPTIIGRRKPVLRSKNEEMPATAMVPSARG